MKIDSDDLKSLYQDFVRSQSPASRQGCLSPEELLLLLRGGGAKKAKRRFVDHLSACGECTKEFGFLLEAARAETALLADLESTDSGRFAVTRRPFFLRLSWGLAPLLVAVFAVGLLLWRNFVAPSHETYRATPSSGIVLVSPRRAEFTASSLVFRWKPVVGAEYYTVEVFDETLKPFWQSDSLSQISAIPPASLTGKLEPRRTYFWMVTAHFPERDTRASSLQEFSLR